LICRRNRHLSSGGQNALGNLARVARQEHSVLTLTLKGRRCPNRHAGAARRSSSFSFFFPSSYPASAC